MPAYYPMPYLADGTRLLRAVGHEPWCQWLDSGWPAASGGRYDILVMRPRTTLESEGGTTRITTRGRTAASEDDPLTLLQQQLDARRETVGASRWPFAGGAVGYFSYDLGRRLHGLPVRAGAGPEMRVGLYDWALVTDHHQRLSAVLGEIDPQTLLWLRERLFACQGTALPAFRLSGGITRVPDAEAYGQAFRRVQHYLHAGDCYQVNLARRLSAPFRGDPLGAWLRMRERAPGPFGAWQSFPGQQVLSISPERFLRLEDGEVDTRPIKGTRRRGGSPQLDRRLAEALQQSAKDRAENVMIVDLLRNDIGQVCETGSVRVPLLCRLETYPAVHHLVSYVTGRLARGRTATDLLRACLPGGSITGAPKRRAMEIIDELEPGPRGVYCGAIGYIGWDGNMDTNIAIRTAVCDNGEIRYWAGGGVVVDSQEEAELRETVDKALPFLALTDGDCP